MSSGDSHVKPILRGHFHQAAFFAAFGACVMLIAESQGSLAVISANVYAFSLLSMLGLSALYHRIQWQTKARLWMRRLDHVGIFLSIAGTGTPICLLAVKGSAGMQLLLTFWLAAVVGILQSLFWVKAPKWLSAILYVLVGWLATPYLGEIHQTTGDIGVIFLLAGGVIYSLGALVYALKKPNPWPRIFGYHEIFHVMVVIAAICHFIVIARIVN